MNAAVRTNLEAWTNNFLTEIAQVAQGDLSDTALRKIMQRMWSLDSIESDAPTKRKALADALLAHPLAIHVIAKLQKVSSPTALLANVRSGLAKAVDHPTEQARVKHEIAEAKTLQLTAKALDLASNDAQREHLRAIQALNQTPAAETLTALIKLHPKDYGIELGDDFAFTRHGLGKRELLYTEPRRAGSQPQPYFVYRRLTTQDVQFFSVAEIDALLKGAIAQIANGKAPRIQPATMRWFWWQ